MSTGEETGTEKAEDAPERPWSVQDMQVDLIRHVYTLAKAGVFAKRQAAQAVLMYYAFNTARYDSEPRGFRFGFVMPGCIYPAAVAKAVSCTPKAVREATVWLHQQRLIKVTDAGMSIEMLPHAWDEELRQKLLDTDGPAPGPELRRGPRLKRKSTPAPAEKDEPETDRTGHCDRLDEEIEPQVQLDRTSGSNDEPVIEPEVRHTLLDSSYIPDTAKQECAPERAPRVVAKPNEEKRGKRAPAAPPPRGAGQPAGDRPSEQDVQKVYQDVIDSVAKTYATQHDVSVADALQYLASGLNAARNLAARVNYLTSVMEALAIADDKRLDILEDYARPSSAVTPRGATPTAAPGSASRAPRGTTYDNTFRFGMAKDGVPYFSKGGKACRTDEGTATLTRDEAVQFFNLLKNDKDAWIDFKHELYEKYRAA